MKYFRVCLFAALVACVALAGCETTSIDATVQKSLPAVCKNAETAKPVIALLIESGKLKGKKADAATAALATLDTLCVDPGSQTAASVLVAALSAYLTVSSAMKSAQAT